MAVSLYIATVDASSPGGLYELYLNEFKHLRDALVYTFAECMKYYSEDRVVVVRDSETMDCLTFASFGLRATPISKPTKEIIYFAENNVFSSAGNISTNDVSWPSLGFSDIRKNLKLMMYTLCSRSYGEDPYYCWNGGDYQSTIIYSMQSGCDVDKILRETIQWMKENDIKPTYLRPIEAMMNGEMSNARALEIISKIKEHSNAKIRTHTKKAFKRAFVRPSMSKKDRLRLIGTNLMTFRMSEDIKDLFDAISGFNSVLGYDAASSHFKSNLPKMNFILWLYAQNRIFES